MGELLTGRIIEKVEADRVCQGVDLRLLSGEEMPARAGFRPPVTADIRIAFFGGELPGFVRIDADENHVEIAAGVEPQVLKTADQRAGDDITHQPAMVITHLQDDGPLPEEVSERDGLPRFIGERQVERDLGTELLLQVRAGGESLFLRT